MSSSVSAQVLAFNHSNLLAEGTERKTRHQRGVHAGCVHVTLVALLPCDGAPLVVQVWMGSMKSDHTGKHLTVCLNINFTMGETDTVSVPFSVFVPSSCDLGLPSDWMNE